MSKYNIEQFCDDLDTFLKANLNTKITAINTEFGAAPVLKTIANSAYFFQTLDDRVTNYNPFVYYEAQNPSVDDGQRGALVETYSILVLICFYNDASDILTGKKLARYNRALKEIFLENMGRFSRKKIKITSLEMAGFAQLNDSRMAHTTGITIEVTFGE